MGGRLTQSLAEQSHQRKEQGEVQGASGLARRFKASIKSDILDPGRHNKAGWLSAESLTNALIRQKTSLSCLSYQEGKRWFASSSSEDGIPQHRKRLERLKASGLGSNKIK